MKRKSSADKTGVKDKAKSVNVSGDTRTVMAAASLTVLMCIISVLLFLHDEEIVILSWKHQRLNTFAHKNVNAWYAPIEDDWLTSPSRTVLLEDGVALKFPNASQQIIVAVGKGRYNMLGDRVLMSTSDNSNPATNGRFYELVARSRLSAGLKAVVFFLTAASMVFLYNKLSNAYDLNRMFMGFIKKRERTVDFAIAGISFCAVVLPFLITRLPFFLYYPVVTMRSDFSRYYEIVRQLDKGLRPMWISTPGYPFFMKAVLIMSNKLLSIVWAQNLLSLFSALFFVFAIFKTYRALTVFAAIGMGAFISSHFHADGDMALLSDSLYANCVILSFAFFILAVNLRKGVYFLLCSFSMGYAVYTRPAGMFFAVIYCIVIFFLFRNKYSLKTIAAYAAPFPLMVVAISLCNFFTMNTLSISSYGEVTSLLGNITLLEEDEKYSKQLNSVIRKAQGLISPKDKEIMASSWKPYEVNEAVFDGATAAGDNNILDMIKEAAGNPPLNQLRNVYRQILHDSIMKHPLIYIKKAILAFFVYFLNINTDTDIYMQLNESYDKIFVEKAHLKNNDLDEVKSVFHEYYDARPLDTFTVLRESYDVERDGVKETLQGHAAEFVPFFLQRLHYHVYTKLQRGLFRNGLWLVAFFMVFGASALQVMQKGDKDAFILFTMGLAAIGHALVVSMVAYNEPRFSYTLEFIYYESAALVPLLLKPAWLSLRPPDTAGNVS